MNWRPEAIVLHTHKGLDCSQFVGERHGAEHREGLRWTSRDFQSV
jgi:hypothetical protein